MCAILFRQVTTAAKQILSGDGKLSDGGHQIDIFLSNA